MPRSPSALRVAFSLARIPRLFCAFLLFPLVVGIGLAFGQLVLTGVYLTMLGRTSDVVGGEFAAGKEHSRSVLQRFGLAKDFSETKICRWTGAQAPPDCELQPFDVTIQPGTRSDTEVAKVIELFSGLTARIHLCQQCRSEITVTLGTENSTNIYDVWSLPILSFVAADNPIMRTRVLELLRAGEEVRDLLGETQLLLPGFSAPVSLTRMKAVFAMIFSIATSLVIGLALALRAHRRILDYFAQNDVLLPLVAACGKGTFYGALWWLTLFRVGAFFLAIGPATTMVFWELVSPETQAIFIGERALDLLLWLVTLVIGMSLLVVVASVGELRHRRPFVSVVYRFGPLVLCAVGGLVWGLTLLLPTELLQAVRHATTATPILGLVAVLITPVFRPPPLTLVLHVLLSLSVLILTLRYNSRWFAAHLEEV